MEITSLLVWTVFITIFLYLWMNYMKAVIIRYKLRDVPGPKEWPIIGITLQLLVPHEELVTVFHNNWTLMKKNSFAKTSLFNEIFIVILHGSALENIINSTQHITKSEFYQYLEPWLGTGLLTSTGKKWRSRRKLLTPAFHFKILDDFIDIFNEQSEILVHHLRKEDKKPFDIFPYITRCALDIICDSAMGRHVNAQGCRDSDYIKAVYGISDTIHHRQISPWLWPDWIFAISSKGRNHNKYMGILHGFTNQVIREKKIALKEKDLTPIPPSEDDNIVLGKKKRLAFLDLLLDFSEDGKKLSNEDLREEVDTFMFEGHDTTAAAISWTLYLLGHNPEIQKKVQEELVSVLGDEACTVTSENLKKLKYLECVIKESLRIYPSVPFMARKLQQEAKIGNQVIPSGVNILISPYFIHRNEEVFPDPEKFDPERFGDENGRDHHPYSYIPFSAGPRNCIGQKFALMEEKIVLSHILHSFKVKSMVPREEMKLLMELILRPKDGILVQLTPRR